MVSVVIAVYRGEKYLRQQLESVLSQLKSDDEVIISDDDINGETYNSVKDIVENDKRIRYVEGPSKGVIKNFEYAIGLTKGNVIFLCDQDDVWLDGKVEICCRELSSCSDLVLHNAQIVDSDLKPEERTAFEANKSNTGIFRNIVKNSYQGSCMAFTSYLKKYILPFPENIPMHDQWIGLVGEKYGRVSLIDTPYILYRRHDATVTGKGSTFSQKLKWRFSILKCLLGR